MPYALGSVSNAGSLVTIERRKEQKKEVLRCAEESSFLREKPQELQSDAFVSISHAQRRADQPIKEYLRMTPIFAVRYLCQNRVVRKQLHNAPNTSARHPTKIMPGKAL